MDTGFIALLIISVVVGFAGGLFVGKKLSDRRYLRDTECTQGTLNVDCSISTHQPGLFLGLGVPVEDVISRRYVALDVRLLHPNSHE